MEKKSSARLFICLCLLDPDIRNCISNPTIQTSLYFGEANRVSGGKVKSEVFASLVANLKSTFAPFMLVCTWAQDFGNSKWRANCPVYRLKTVNASEVTGKEEDFQNRLRPQPETRQAEIFFRPRGYALVSRLTAQSAE
jgi:hypothetical protein